MKLNKIDKVFIILFIIIVSYSIYNDKIKNKEQTKQEVKIYNDEYELIEEHTYYKLYEKDYVDGKFGDYYKYIIYDINKNVIAEKEIDRYTYINFKDNIVEVRMNYGTKATLSELYNIKKGKLSLEKQNVCFYNNDYVVICNIEDIEIQNIENKDKFYKKIKIDKDIVNNIISIKFKNSDLIIKYENNHMEKEYIIEDVF